MKFVAKTTLSRSAALLLSCGIATLASAANLGEFLDKGAKKLGKAEQRSMVAQGRTVTGETFSGEARIELTFVPDGTFSGNVVVIKGRYIDEKSKSTGTWTVDDNGRFCMKEHLVDWNRYNNYCYYSFALDDQLVLSLSDSDRSAKAVARPRGSTHSANRPTTASVSPPPADAPVAESDKK